MGEVVKMQPPAGGCRNCEGPVRTPKAGHGWVCAQCVVLLNRGEGCPVCGYGPAGLTGDRVCGCHEKAASAVGWNVDHMWGIVAYKEKWGSDGIEDARALATHMERKAKLPQ